jgi:hypothetical protein
MEMAIPFPAGRLGGLIIQFLEGLDSSPLTDRLVGLRTTVM